ncbi:MAG TPA: M48 family peptidase [Myxococcales bacterium]|nr:M48 family peptidase [Myxococcales bacterium]
MQSRHLTPPVQPQPGRSRLSTGLVPGFAALVILAACATSPLGRSQLKLFPDDQLAQMGSQSFEQIKRDKEISQDGQRNDYVSCVATTLIAQLSPEWRSGWEVVIFDDPSANAFAVPGRRIGVHSGILAVATSPDQLAAILGHEISHVLASHGNERMSQVLAAQAGLLAASAATDSSTPGGRATLAALGLGAQFGILLPFSRSHENEADLMGLDLMAQAGFDPRAAIALWHNMAAASKGQPPEWMSSHPAHGSRIRELENRMPRAEAIRDRAVAAGRKPDCPRPPEEDAPASD